MFKKTNTPDYFVKNITVVVGLVLVWRGIWHMLDEIDVWFFSGNPFLTSFVGFVVGILVLYLPDKDLKEIEKL